MAQSAADIRIRILKRMKAAFGAAFEPSNITGCDVCACNDVARSRSSFRPTVGSRSVPGSVCHAIAGRHASDRARSDLRGFRIFSSSALPYRAYFPPMPCVNPKHTIAYYQLLSKALMRSSIGGWVINSLANPDIAARGPNGFAKKRCAVALLARFMGCEYEPILRSALASPSG